MNFGAELIEVIERFPVVIIPLPVPAVVRRVQVSYVPVTLSVPFAVKQAAVSFTPVLLVVPSVIRTREADEMRAVEFEKYAGEDEIFTLDWSLRGVTVDDPITASDWTVPMPMSSSSSGHDDTTTSAMISGGVPGRKYTLLNTITTRSHQVKVCQVNFVVS